MFHDRKVMGDEQKRDLRLFLDVLEQIHDLGLDTDIQCGNWFVRHDELRINRQRARNPDSLALPAAELMRISSCIFRFQADQRKQFGNALRAFFRIQLRMELQRLLNRGIDAHARVQRTVGVLKDHLEIPPHPAQLFAFDRAEIHPVQQNGTIRRGFEAHQQTRHRAFAASAFSDQSERFPDIQLE